MSDTTIQPADADITETSATTVRGGGSSTAAASSSSGPAAVPADLDSADVGSIEAPAVTVPTGSGSPADVTAPDKEHDRATTDETASADPVPANRTNRASTVLARVRKSRAASGKAPSLGKRGRLPARAAAVAVLAASIGASVTFYRHDAHSRELLDAQQQAQAAACKYAPLLATYDAKNLDAYFTAVLDGATGDWRKQFDSTSKDLREVLSQGQVVSKATDVQCAIRNADRNSAEAIVVIGQTITSLGTQGKPAPGQLSMVMRLERSGDRWLVNKVNSPLAQQPQQ